MPADTDTQRLDRGVRQELRSLPPDLAEIVAGHLLLAGELIETDPEAADAHARAARRRASRMAIVREAAAETAYAAGRYDTALGEYRALRRMTGDGDYLPVMADCERALGKTDAALRLIDEADEQIVAWPSQVELRIVEAGVRADLGQVAEAERLLQATIDRLRAVSGGDRNDGSTHGSGQRRGTGGQPKPEPQELSQAQARLHYALAEVLLLRQQTDRARREFAQAAECDADEGADAAERVDELDGLVIEFDDRTDDSDDEHEAAGGHEDAGPRHTPER